MKKSIFIIMIGLILLLISGCGSSGEFTLNGVVFLDENNNGIMEENEQGIDDITINYNEGNVTTNSKGEYTIKTDLSTINIEVDESKLNTNYMLTTNNDTQTINFTNSSLNAEDIGYTSLLSENADSENILFKDILSNKKFTNYYFEAIMINGSMESSFELWVIDNSIKMENQGQTIFYNSSQGIMGVYTASVNQVVITSIVEEMEFDTPFSLVSDLDAETFDMINYTGTENLDGKKVYVFENTIPGFEAVYYVWAETGIIVKMDAIYGEMTSSIYFKDLTLNEVTEADIQYPSGAEVLDLTAF